MPLMKMHLSIMSLLLFTFVVSMTCIDAFHSTIHVATNTFHRSSPMNVAAQREASTNQQDVDIIARRIMVSGDVNGGYVRTCILNEAGRFRKLIGTMSPPSDSDTAEIYVEGTTRNVEGFIRWCKKGTKSVGLSQKLDVIDIIEEEPTGLYDGFYVKTGL